MMMMAMFSARSVRSRPRERRRRRSGRWLLLAGGARSGGRRGQRLAREEEWRKAMLSAARGCAQDSSLRRWATIFGRKADGGLSGGCHRRHHGGWMLEAPDERRNLARVEGLRVGQIELAPCVCACATDRIERRPRQRERRASVDGALPRGSRTELKRSLTSCRLVHTTASFPSSWRATRGTARAARFFTTCICSHVLLCRVVVHVACVPVGRFQWYSQTHAILIHLLTFLCCTRATLPFCVLEARGTTTVWPHGHARRKYRAFAALRHSAGVVAARDEHPPLPASSCLHRCYEAARPPSTAALPARVLGARRPLAHLRLEHTARLSHDCQPRGMSCGEPRALALPNRIEARAVRQLDEPAG